VSAQARPTAGRWLHDYTKIGRVVAENGAELARCKNLTTLNELQARGDLIAEAGTVLHETGRTPRQLVEERAELLKALESIAYGGAFGLSGQLLARIAQGVIDKTKGDKA
jgi:hypothetical protein